MVFCGPLRYFFQRFISYSPTCMCVWGFDNKAKVVCVLTISPNSNANREFATKFQNNDPEFEPCGQPTLYSCTMDVVAVRYITFLSERKLLTNLNRLFGHFIFISASYIDGHQGC